MDFDVNNEVHTIRISRDNMQHERESLHLEKKNMLRTFLGLKLKNLRTSSEGFIEF